MITRQNGETKRADANSTDDEKPFDRLSAGVEFQRNHGVTDGDPRLELAGRRAHFTEHPKRVAHRSD